MSSRSTAGRLLLALGLAAPAVVSAIQIGGGGSRQSDCLLSFVGAFNDAPYHPTRYRCTDGDPNCDADGTVNGRCEVAIAVCANSTFDPTRCTLSGIQSSQVAHALDNGDARFDTEFQALQQRIDTELDPPVAGTFHDLCTNPVTFHVQVLGPFKNNACRRNRKSFTVTTYTPIVQGRQSRDVDNIRLQCDPAGHTCDPSIFFSGTFDRIQRQVFTPSCAVSGCHDSQSQQGGLLLETGAAESNLIGADPSNPAALGLGWKRVLVTSPTTGDAANSYLYHKVAGQLPAGTGARMPFQRAALDATLVEIIRLWIEAGAPTVGWVPGTM